MTGDAYIVRCQRCGVARKSYNNPTRGISVIECKRPCGDSHYEWSLIRIIPATEEWPPALPAESDIPVYIPPARVAHASTERDGSPSPSRTTATGASKVEFSSKGKGSVVRSRSTSGGGNGVLTVAVNTSVKEREQSAKREGMATVTSPSTQAKEEKGDCFVQ